MEQDIANLQQQIKGKILMPGNAAYEAKQHVFNAVGQPAIIAQCVSAQDVAETLQFAKKHKLKLSVRSGGHGASGAATNKGGLVLDVSPMNSIKIIDAERRIVRIGAGATWGQVATTLEPHGLTISAGDTNQVGVGGLVLGGGFGWLVRTYGLAIDALQSVELVTPGGTWLTASASQHADLFWAVRGGGGNFGVAIAFEFVAQRHADIYGGEMTFVAAETSHVLDGLATYMRTAPDELNVIVDIGPEMLKLNVCYASDQKTAADQAIAPLTELGKVQTSDIAKKPYSDMFGNVGNKPPDFRVLQMSGFIRHFDNSVANQIAKHFGKNGQPKLEIRFLGGACARVDEDETAVAYRDCEALVIVTDFAPPGTSEVEARKIAATAWQPLTSHTEGAYINFVTYLDKSVSVFPPATRARLQTVKAKYDPTNLFNQMQVI